MKRALLSILAFAALVAAVLLLRRPEPPAEAEAIPPAEASAAEALPEVEAEPLDGGPAEEESEAISRAEIAPDAPSIPAGGGTSVPAPPPNSARVRGRLTDTLTGELLPFYAMQVSDVSGLPEAVTTDEDGRFETAAALASGALRFRFVDSRAQELVPGETMRERAVVDGEAEDVELSIASGPTFHFSILPADAAPATELVARLHVANLDAKGSTPPEYLRVGIGSGPLGEAPWVRFSPVPEQFDRAEYVHLASVDGLWTGESKTSVIRGDVRELVPLFLEARGVLLGKVVDPEGTPINGARLGFEATTAAGDRVSVSERTGADGAFRLPYLAGSSGTLSVRSLRHLPQDAGVRVVPGHRTHQDFVLQKLPLAGEIGGRVESRTGTFDPRIEVTLVPLETQAWTEGEPRPRRTTEVEWSTIEGRRVGRFDFGPFPAGTYEVRVRERGYLRWEPDRAVVSPPSPEIVLLVQDDQANADFVFRVRDADDGAELDGVQVSFQHSGRGAAAPWSRLGRGAPALARFPVGRPFRWRLDLPGYSTATGDEKAFAIEEQRGSRPVRIAEVSLRRGWGEVFRVISKSNQRPVAGAAIRLDGKIAGTTGPDGLLRVEAPAKPALVEIVYRDWALAAPLDLRAAWLRREKRFVTATLAPPPPLR